MSLSSIWWQQVGSSLRMRQKVVRRLQNEESFVLRVPLRMPWQEDFYELMRDRLSSLNANRMVRFLTCDSALSPGQQILNELCSEDVRTSYWPGQSYAEYLAGLRDVPFNQMFIWVKNIMTSASLEQWRSFAAQYRASRSAEAGAHAVFILEYHTDNSTSGGSGEVIYSISDRDCQVFCLEASALFEELPWEYLSTLALCVGGGDPEKCAVLIQAGKEFLSDPEVTGQEILSQGYYSNEEPFPIPQEGTVRSSVWRAQIMVLFPLLEAHRFRYIYTNYDRLQRYLPLPDENGAVIHQPYDLEFGNLYYLTRQVGTSFSREEAENIRICRSIRNLLAHNNLVPYEDVMHLLRMETSN